MTPDLIKNPALDVISIVVADVFVILELRVVVAHALSVLISIVELVLITAFYIIVPDTSVTFRVLSN